jgi:hypothetical protein
MPSSTLPHFACHYVLDFVSVIDTKVVWFAYIIWYMWSMHARQYFMHFFLKLH